MKKQLLLLIIFSFLFQTGKAQYFDWAKYIDGAGGCSITDAEFIDCKVAPNGTQIVRYYTTCGHGGADEKECYIDTLGNVYGQQVMWQAQRYSFFDRFSNLIQIVESGIDFDIKYFKSDTVIFPIAYVPTMLETDTLKNLFIFSGANVSVYDSTGLLLNSYTVSSVDIKVNYGGEIFTYEKTSSPVLNKYNSAGILIHQYSVDADHWEISRQSGQFWIEKNNVVTNYDSLGTVIDTLAINYPNDFEMHAGANDVLFVTSTGLNFTIDSTGVLQKYMPAPPNIVVDDNNNVYHYQQFVQIPSPYNNDTYIYYGFSLPPDLNVPDEIYVDYVYEINYSLFSQRITYQYLDSFSMNISYVSSQPWCKGDGFEAHVIFDNLPFYADTLVYIELSDSTGSFANPFVVSKGHMMVKCKLTDTIPDGSGYLLRARLGASILYSPVYNNVLSIHTKPDATIFLANSVSNRFACKPFELSAMPVAGLNYEWRGYVDPQDFYLGNNDSITIPPADYYDAFSLEVRDPLTGCFAITYKSPEELDSLNPPSLNLNMPDTVRINDSPLQIGFTSYIHGTISGPGIIYSNNVTFFYPVNAQQGINAIQHNLNVTGAVCIPTSHTQYIYVDSVPRNIVIDSIADNYQIILLAGLSIMKETENPTARPIIRL